MNLKRALTNAVRALDKARDLTPGGLSWEMKELNMALTHVLTVQGRILQAERDRLENGRVLVAV
jgi:hypothetical protein